MSALAVDTPRTYEGSDIRDTNELPVKGSTKIYEGAFVGDDGSGDARQLVAADPFLGIAFRQADNSAGADGAIRVRLVERGGVVMDVTGVTGVGDVGDTVYASDSATLTKTAGSNTAVGKIKRYISGTKCVIAFEAVTARSL